ncbi:hypothetical protein V5739_13670 [Salinimicrobium sp. TIG7-5_MAKvit]|uniref:hypothetical protein n=1 Tax=Salinimicrobium sp. TIG7-5_MAKvit TaxID=3121289 RepID=UPI003C6DCDB1
MKELNAFLILFLVANMGYAQNDPGIGEEIKQQDSTAIEVPVEVVNREYFKDFFEESKKSLLLVGENHSSSVASGIYPPLIEYHYKENGVKTLFIEFGPAEAYFYSKYLATGEERHLKYTIYAGYYKDWMRAWKEIYEFNETLEEPLEIVGVDFDRARTFAYALYSILSPYEGKPTEIDSLLNVIKSQEFYNTYTVGYPTELDMEFVTATKELLKRHTTALEKLLKPEDKTVVERMVQNKALGFNDERELHITANVTDFVKKSGEQEFLMLVGRDHTYLDAIYDDDLRLASYLKKETDFTTLTGLILHENSQQWGENYTKEITLYEVRDKIPWKEYFQVLDSKAVADITVVPLKGELEPLTQYVDYVIIARNMGPIQF